MGFWVLRLMAKYKPRLDHTRQRFFSEDLGAFELILWFLAAINFVLISGKATHSSAVLFHTLVPLVALQFFCIVSLVVKSMSTRLWLMGLIDACLVLYTVVIWRNFSIA